MPACQYFLVPSPLPGLQRAGMPHPHLVLVPPLHFEQSLSGWGPTQSAVLPGPTLFESLILAPQNAKATRAYQASFSRPPIFRYCRWWQTDEAAAGEGSTIVERLCASPLKEHCQRGGHGTTLQYDRVRGPGKALAPCGLVVLTMRGGKERKTMSRIPPCLPFERAEGCSCRLRTS